MRYRAISIFVLSLILTVTAASTTAQAQTSKFKQKGIAGFEDIGNHWAEAAISKWAQRGFVQGRTARRFAPDEPIMRAETAKMFNRALGAQSRAKIGFADVAAGKWYYEEVSRALATGYMHGYADGLFKPEVPISRQEFAVLIVRLLHLPGHEPGAAYPDAQKAPAWSRESIGAAAEAGLMIGVQEGRFAPLAPVTRAEALVIIDRAILNAQMRADAGDSLPAESAAAGGAGKETAASEPGIAVPPPDIPAGGAVRLPEPERPAETLPVPQIRPVDPVDPVDPSAPAETLPAPAPDPLPRPVPVPTPMPPASGVVGVLENVYGVPLSGSHTAHLYEIEEGLSYNLPVENGLVTWDLPAGMYRLLDAEPAGGTNVDTEGYGDIFAVRGSEALTIGFTARTRNVELRLAAPDGLEAGLKRLHIVSEDGLSMYRARSLNERFALSLPDGRYEVERYEAGDSSVKLGEPFTVQGGRAELDLPVPPAADVRVVDSSGQPLASGRIRVRSDIDLADRSSSRISNGQAALRAEQGTPLRAYVEYPVGPLGYPFTETIADPVTLEPGKTSEIVVHGYNVRGTLSREAQPLPQQAKLLFRSLADGKIHEASVVQGEFYARVVPGDYEAIGYLGERSERIAFSYRFAVPDRPEPYTLEIKLAETDIRANTRGRLTYADGTPVAYAVLNAVPKNAQSSVSLNAIPIVVRQGEFAAELEPGTYVVQDYQAAGSRTSLSAEFEAGTRPDSLVELRLPPPSLSGLIRHPSGNPVKTGRLAITQGGQEYFTVFESGTFVLPLPDGTYTDISVSTRTASFKIAKKIVIQGGQAVVNPLEDYTLPSS
ncbi:MULTISPECIES: S-layer homology domain-containing protein [Saccharibacillus]|uniref:S-layer homology domain-containing protein n=1 Tax=Saccharibacillus TaxID=456492 RepID=UPI001365DF95|nr:S-layer homology domain-containing protein [Saccharibacillus sp. WB 17]